jgi:hypothetical protein
MHLKTKFKTLVKPSITTIQGVNLTTTHSRKFFFSWSVVIVAFTAITSYIFWAVTPFGFGKFGLALACFKAAIVTLWLCSAWRVRKTREEAFARNERMDNIWSGPIEERGLKVPQKVLEVIRYHFDKDEKIVAVFRQHWFALWKTVMWAGITLFLICLAVVLNKYAPGITFHTKAVKDFHLKAREVHITYWWIPLLFVLFAFYEALRHWQDWSWTIWAVSNFNFYRIREQSMFMAWAGKKFHSTPVGQIIDVSSYSDRAGGTFGWGDIMLEVRVDEHRDQSEPLFVRYVADDEEVEKIIRSVLPAYDAPDTYENTFGSEPAEQAPKLWVAPERRTKT